MNVKMSRREEILNRLRDERARERFEKLVEGRAKSFLSFERMMQGDVEFNFSVQKNHLDQWETKELTRVNKWRPADNKLLAPTPAMYEAKRLSRYLSPEQRMIRVTTVEMEARTSGVG
jgi:hypothetical protein